MPEGTQAPVHGDAKSFALDFIARNREGLRRICDSIFYFGELGMQEKRSAALMSSLLEEHGFSVERGISGFPTAFLATYGSGSPVIAIHLPRSPVWEILTRATMPSGMAARMPIRGSSPVMKAAIAKPL